MTRHDTSALLKHYILPGICFLSPAAGIAGFGPFVLICLYIFIDLMYEGFTRRSRFGLSQNHSTLDRILSYIIVLLPFTVFIFHYGAAIFMPFLLGLHILSELRSPDKSAAEKSKYERPLYKYIAWLVFYLLGLLGYFFI